MHWILIVIIVHWELMNKFETITSFILIHFNLIDSFDSTINHECALIIMCAMVTRIFFLREIDSDKVWDRM